MTETAVATVGGEVAGSNGIGVAGIEIPEEVRKEIDRGVASMSPDQQRKAVAELEAMLAATRGAVEKAGNAAPADAPTSTATPTPAATPAAKAAAPAAPAVASDPYPTPSHMVESREIAFLWSQEAIEKSSYLVTHEAWKRAHPTFDLEDFRNIWVDVDGVKMIKRFRPLDGYLLEADGGGDSGMPVVFKWLVQQPLLVSTASGRIVESKGPTNVVVHACHALHKLIPLMQFDGCVRGRLEPMGWQTALSGEREWMILLWVEPDDADPRKPKLISLESALGKSARG